MITAILTIITTIRNWWKIILAALIGIFTAFFALNYQRRGKQLEASEQAIKGLKARERVEIKKDTIGKKRDKKIKEVKDAPKDNLIDHLNSLDE